MNISYGNFSRFPRWFSFCHVIVHFPSPPSCYQLRITQSSDVLLPFASSISDESRHCRIIVLVSPIEDIESTVMEVAKVNDTTSSLVEQSMNVTSATKSVATSKSVESVQTKSVVESSTSVKSVTSSSTRSQQSMEYEETIEFSE